MLSCVSVFQGGGIQCSNSTNEKFNKVTGTADRKYEWVPLALSFSSIFLKQREFSDEILHVLYN